MSVETRSAVGSVMELANLHIAPRFFADTLPVADAYLLMQVIHDWNDDRAARIIEAIRRSMLPDARVLVIETAIGEQPASHWDRLRDIAMLSILGGKERTRDQYARLLAQSNLRLDREIDIGAGVSILEAVPA